MNRVRFFPALFFFIASALTAQNIRELNEGWTFCESGKKDGKPAYVPGNIYRDLQMNNLIADPTVGENIQLCQWVEKKDWEYTCVFDYPDIARFEHIELVLDGLDTYADVTLNDNYCLQAKNMFRSYTIPVQKVMREHGNILKIIFHNPVKSAKEWGADSAKVRYPADNDPTSPFTRKAAFHYGWDFSPRLAGCAIRKKIYLRAWNDFIIRDLHAIQQSVSKTEALMEAEVQIECDKPDTLQLELLTNGMVRKEPMKKGLNSIVIPYTVLKPELWWPNEMGTQKMYELYVQVQNRKRSVGKSVRYGIRTLEVVNEKDKDGKSFYLKINGVPLYAKGSNYVPGLGLYNASAPADPFAALFATMKECHMNMVRVWGGGIYEDDAFYELADRNGILVWQDFMFANTMYPADSMFLDNVKKEAEYNIVRLRNHPALALWCGNNEVEVAWKNWGWQKKYKYSAQDSIKLWNNYEKLFLELLPSEVKTLDPGRFYFSSSPQSNWGKKEDLNYGDNHYWGVWHGEEPLEAYTTHVPRFASEFGFPSFPAFSSVKRFSKAPDWITGSPVLNAHQFSYKGNGLISKYMNSYYHAPKNFSSYLYLSQLLQAEALKTAIVSQRMKQPFCMGSLYWQLNDCWPAVSWSGMDYYGQWKAAQYFVRKAFEPVCAVYDENNNVLVVSDSKDKEAMHYTLQLVRFDGKVICSTLSDIVLEPGKVMGIMIHGALYDSMKTMNKENTLLKLEGFISGKPVSPVLIYFSPIKKLKLPLPVLQKELSKKGDTLVLSLKTNVLAKNVFVDIPGATMINAQGDNYFDLLPGEEKFLYFFSDKSVEELKKMISIKTLRDTY